MSPRVALLLVLACSACEEKKPDTTTATASATATSAPPPASASVEKPKSDKLPLIEVDAEGPVVDGQASYLNKPGGMDKLVRTVSEVPINGREVPIKVQKKAKLSDVVALVKVLGEKGAPTVKISADSRGDLPNEIVVTPQSKVTAAPPPCSLVAMITAKFETDVWNVQGSTAKKHGKGRAGPDLSIAGETIAKELKKCDSKQAFFSADDTLGFEYAFMVAGAFRVQDTEKKIEQLVLLNESPVPGRPIKLP